MVSAPTRLSRADRERLARIIGEGEMRTAAELVVVIADSCGHYGVFGFLWPALSALVVGGVVALGFPAWPGTRLFVIEALIFLLLAGLLRWNRLLLRLVPSAVRRAHAEHTAGHQFSIRVQGRTPQKVGVLLFAALAERQVFILPDSGISTIVDPDAWRTIVDRLVLGMRSGPATDAFAATIGEIFAVLSMHSRDGTTARECCRTK